MIEPRNNQQPHRIQISYQNRSRVLLRNWSGFLLAFFVISCNQSKTPTITTKIDSNTVKETNSPTNLDQSQQSTTSDNNPLSQDGPSAKDKPANHKSTNHLSGSSSGKDSKKESLDSSKNQVELSKIIDNPKERFDLEKITAMRFDSSHEQQLVQQKSWAAQWQNIEKPVKHIEKPERYVPGKVELAFRSLPQYRFRLPKQSKPTIYSLETIQADFLFGEISPLANLQNHLLVAQLPLSAPRLEPRLLLPPEAIRPWTEKAGFDDPATDLTQRFFLNPDYPLREQPFAFYPISPIDSDRQSTEPTGMSKKDDNSIDPNKNLQLPEPIKPVLLPAKK